MTEGNDEIIIATRKGMAIRFNENDVRPMGRQARGVKALKLKENDYVIGMSVIDEDGYVLTVSSTGYGRLSSPSDYRTQSRGGKGLTNYHIEKYGEVAALSVVSKDDDVIIISANGVIIRIKADTIRLCARPSKGVTVMKIKDDNEVVTVAAVPHEDEETDEVVESENADVVETTEETVTE